MRPVVVLGGGPAGLYAGLLLARRRIPVVVLEREERPGGLTAGTVVDGLAVDYGSHRLHHSIDPAILADLSELPGLDLRSRQRNGRIRLDGQWLSFPIRPGEMVGRLRRRILASLAAGAVRATFRRGDPTTFASFVRTGLGDPMGDLFYFPYARKIWGLDPEHLSGEQARRRIRADSPVKLVRTALSGGAGRRFLYPDGGFGRIASALAEAATDAGADVRLGTSVTAVSPRDHGHVVETTESAVDAAMVLSTIPVTVLARLLEPPPHVADAVSSLRHRAMVIVYLVASRDRWTPYDAHYFPGADVVFTRVSEPKNYRDQAHPEDRTVICVEVPADADDATWNAPDSDLIALVRSQVTANGLPDPGGVGVVHRIRHAYPVYTMGAEAAFDRVAGWIDEQAGVVTFGRQGLFAHDNTHHALAMARDAVACVADGGRGFDRAGWDVARRRFRDHVVED